MAGSQPAGATLPAEARLKPRDKPLKRSDAGSPPPPKRRCDTSPSTDSSGSSPTQEANHSAQDLPSQDELVFAPESVGDIQKAADDSPELSPCGSLVGSPIEGSLHQSQTPLGPISIPLHPTPRTNAKSLSEANSTQEACLLTKDAGRVSTRDTELNVEGTRYSVRKKIGQGSFGVVFEGIRCFDKKDVALKFEPKHSKAPQLRNEYRMYRDLSGSPGIPDVYQFGTTWSKHVLVMPLLGKSLDQLFQHRRFTLKTVHMLGVRMTEIIKGVHEKQFVYRDMKPANLVVGASKKDTSIHLVDFGMCKKYWNSEKNKHIPYRENCSLSGTARYMSINTHLGREQSRRDDIEAIGYILAYFERRRLPWQGIRVATSKEQTEAIGRMKQETAVKKLCKSPALRDYIAYARNLGFEDPPDYGYLKGLLLDALKENSEDDDGRYCWVGS